MKYVTGAFLVLGLSIVVQIVSAQEDVCEPVVQASLVSVQDACDAVGSGQACYAAGSVEVEFLEGFGNLTFEEIGDKVEVAGLQTLSLSTLDAASQTWGLVVVQLPADSMTNQDTTLVLMGEVEFRNRVESQSVALPVTATADINIRRAPSVDSAVAGGLNAGEAITAIGRLDDSSWLNVRLPGNLTETGWIFADLLTTEGDLDSLSVVDPGSPQVVPAPTFHVRSGNQTAACADVPQAGVLIQSPEDTLVTLVLNDATLRLRGAAFFQAGDEMVINVIQGSAQVAVGDATRYVPAGARLAVALDNLGSAVGIPDTPQPYDEQFMQSVPVGLLPREVTIFPALTAEEIAAQTACLATALDDVNQRGGPGTGYPVQGRLADGEIAVPDGQALGRDGISWWRLANQNWVRSDLVDVVGNCTSLPEVEAPPLAVAVSATYRIEACIYRDTGAQVGEIVQLSVAGGTWPTRAEARQALSGLSGAISVDGEALPVSYSVLVWGENNYGVRAFANWSAIPGTHAVSGSLNLFGISHSCTFSVG